ncbi:MAG: hypothetical protein JW982_08200 [Spirochaetes bacterium]|nr:hypothetical protein [Spirochaetota bacterium]
MNKLFPFLLISLLISCSSQSKNIKYDKAYKKQPLNVEFYFPEVPDNSYILIKRYGYTDSLLSLQNFTEKRVKENLDKINMRDLIIEAVNANLGRMSKRIIFDVKENGYSDVSVNLDNITTMVNQSDSEQPVNEMELDLSPFADRLTEKYIFILRVDSWGFKYVDYKGGFFFLNTTGIIYDIENKKIIWRRIRNTEIPYNTSVQFIGFTDVRSKYYSKEAVKSMIDDYILDLRR